MAPDSPKRVRFSRHARLRMKERGISDAQVKGAILKAQVRAPTADPSRTRVRFELAGKILEVIYAETPDRIVVVTAVWATRKSK